MKKYIIVRLILVILIATLMLILVSTGLSLNLADDSFEQSANDQIDQISEILERNEYNIGKLNIELKEDFFIRTKAVSYILHKNPELLSNPDEIVRIAELMQIDQIHLFDDAGAIFSGSLPDFYGYTLYSGKQISHFLPMLHDKNLELAQEVTRNSGQNKEMQYFAIWSENKEYIVQIGVDPVRLVSAMQETELSYIFSHLTPSLGIKILAVDPKNGHILSSTDLSLIGTNINSYAISDFNKDTIENNIHDISILNTDGKGYFKEVNGILIGVYGESDYIYELTSRNINVVIATGLLLGVISIVLIYHMLDKVVLRSLFDLRDGMTQITAGNLDYKMKVHGLPEFETLSAKTNLMVQSVLDSSRKFSTIFQYVNIPLAVYEHRGNNVTVTSKMGELLEMPESMKGQKTHKALEFLEIVGNIMQNPYLHENDVYVFNHKGKDKYLKIKLYSEETSDWGIIIDVTAEMTEIQTIKHERDMDFLTNIYNRRAFLEAIKELSDKPEVLKQAVLVMMDLDNLKYVNDTWGHAYGDNYICKTAEVLKSFKYENKLVARLSGDEFVILLYGAQSNEELAKHVHDLEEDFKAAYILNPDARIYNITISGGYAFYPEHSTKFKEILHLADQTMYEVKKAKKGVFKMYKENKKEEDTQK